MIKPQKNMLMILFTLQRYSNPYWPFIKLDFH
jgi:hypothetical protein